MSQDALLVVSFGGPERPEEVMPFLENVLRGRSVPRERMLEVARHYDLFGGRSPINDQNRELIAALRTLFEEQGPRMDVYWGNRNWHPLLSDTLQEMARAGVTRAFAFVTSAFSSYSGCRQYREDIERARTGLGEGAPRVEKLRGLFNHPGFIAACADRLRSARVQAPEAPVVFTAHSIPLSMAAGCAYESQLREATRLVAEASGVAAWTLAYQSRSGPPGQPWLEPDVNDQLRRLASEGADSVVVVPIGFLSDHMEVVYDLDTEAKATADGLGLRLVRAGTPGCHPALVAAIRELVLERLENAPRRVAGNLDPLPDVCPAECCPAPARPPRA